MRRLIFLLFTLLHTKVTVSILVQDHRHHQHSNVGYIYNKPISAIPQRITQYKPVSSLFPSYHQSIINSPPSSQSHQTLSPLTFHPSSSSLQSSNSFHSGHLPESIHFDIPPAILHNFLTPDDEIYYAEDGRILKQYEVMERIIGDLQHPGHFLTSSPLYLDSLVSKYVAQNPNLRGQIYHPVTRNHGPIALGSGSLGYIQLANGGAHLGSGSLGYISGLQASQAVVDAKTRKALAPPGPLHFGHSFGN